MNLLHYAAYAVFALAFAQAAYTDQSQRTIGNRALLAMLAAGLFISLTAVYPYPWGVRLLLYLIMALGALILWNRKDTPGGGDIKLLFILGLTFNIWHLLWLVLVTLALVGGTRLLSKTKNIRYPLGSYLFLAWLVSLPLL